MVWPQAKCTAGGRFPSGLSLQKRSEILIARDQFQCGRPDPRSLVGERPGLSLAQDPRPAWSHRIVNAGDWVEVDSLQCHIVHWLGKGKGVVFKAGAGPLAEVGKLGVKGKPPCADCPCMKPEQVRALETLKT
jgi:hypothetical protein